MERRGFGGLRRGHAWRRPPARAPAAVSPATAFAAAFPGERRPPAWAHAAPSARERRGVPPASSGPGRGRPLRRPPATTTLVMCSLPPHRSHDTTHLISISPPTQHAAICCNPTTTMPPPLPPDLIEPFPPAMDAALPAAVLSRLDARSLLAAAACRGLRTCASHALAFLPSFHLLVRILSSLCAFSPPLLPRLRD